MQNIQVAIVDAHQLSREGLKALLAGGAYEVISATTTLDAALGEITAGLRPGLLVLVLGDRGETFQDAALQQIRAAVPDCKVALIANDGSSALLERAIGWRVNALLRSDMSM